MRLERAELRVVSLPLLKPFRTSFGVMTDKNFVLLRLFGEGLEGVAEGVMDLRPDFREETISGALALLQDTVLPGVLGRSWANPEQLMRHLSGIRGNRMALATVEMAFWDLWARSLEQPLCAVLGGVRDAVNVGVSLGIQKSVEATVDSAVSHAEQGYKRIKLKIQPGWDVDVVRAVKAALPNTPVTVDANAAYTLAHLNTLRELDTLGLDYIEQPLAWNDMRDHAKLQALMNTPLCLDECITTAQDARKALETAACRLVNIKVGRVGGHLEARRVHDVAAAFNAPVWCGGMLESGVGRAHNIHLATLENFSKPGDTSSSSRYWARDLIHEALETTDGVMPVPAGHGIGVTLDLPFLDSVTQQKFEVGPARQPVAGR
ncbi:o-succinylbenzoate synthase [Deinococcus radiopugnans]|uniref:o-succinylbenzoate synthase n=1 Tax=Deinococcus radiopugnans ATCC 19172 TaxID=585398 RepID=A0A5C4Y895_9DEIO|nr:o-succinylbenzoate synthase [Deinococcus radiopugnans]MBB6014897.1 O-succinylbenzoate synthase [Deinococcus radiopugnans ATCC 19172]TNM71686.1 o-succinylbenzoate synthase [Deinococcus radiopugnans ATCC 19172]